VQVLKQLAKQWIPYSIDKQWMMRINP
jgi:hypothetical protein